MACLKRCWVALWQAQHLARFKAGAIELGIAFPEADINTSLSALCQNLRGHYVLRLTLTRGAAGRGLAADTQDFTYIATLQAFDAALMFRPLDLVPVSIRRNETSPASRIKVTSYMDAILAAREAAAKGFDDGLMLNNKGFVASTTIGNLFLVKGNHFVTPSLDQGILPGIMRSVVITLAPQAGFHVAERAIEACEFEAADGYFVTNSLRFLRPSKGYAQAQVQTLIDLLCAAAQQQTGQDPRTI
jgi:branched-chain amino acid aminotransferase